MKQKFNIKVANRCATVHVIKEWYHREPDYPKISVYHSWSQMSSEKGMRILTNSINIRRLKRALIARRMQMELSMDKINAISKSNFSTFINGIIWE